MATNLIRAANPIWFFVDLVGLPLNDQYYISFLSNTFPYLPQLVYSDNQGVHPWTNPLQFYPNGTLPDNIYWQPLVYRLEIRQGPLQSDPLVYTINDFDPSGTGGITPVTPTPVNTDNEITNPQFAYVNFTTTIASPVNPTISFSAAGTYNIAPGWNLILTGTGNATVTQVISTGSQNLPLSPVPPYFLRITTNGWTTAVLYQRLNGNGGLFSNNFISMSVLAQSESGVTSLVFVYAPNSGAPTQINSATSLGTGKFFLIQGAVAIPTSTDATLNNAAYVDIQIQLPPTGIVDISNVQVAGQNTLLTVPFSPSPETTIESQTDSLFHYYLPKLLYEQIPSYLTGWDFPLNPAQISGTIIAPLALGPNTSFYAWDQTIIYQSLTSGIGITRGIAGALTLTAAAATQIAVIQYLSSFQIKKMLLQNLSVNLSAFSTAASGTQFTISLWYTTDASLPSTVGSNQSIVATLDANGKPATFNGNWVEITRSLGMPASGIITATANFSDYNFNGWQSIPIATAATATYFAIVIGTAAMTNTDILSINSVGLCAGDIATRPSPQSPSQVLGECQYYYEKSYDPASLAGAVTLAGAPSVQLSSATGNISGLDRPFKITKRVTPSVTWYSPITGTPSRVRNATAGSDLTVTANVNLGLNSTGFVTTSAPGGDGDEITAQWVADARLGL